MVKQEKFLLIEDGYQPDLNKYYEGLMTQGNGYLSVRASFEEGLLAEPQNQEYQRTMASVTTEVQRHTISKCGTFIPPIMCHHPQLADVIVNLPNPLDFRFYIDGEKLDLWKSTVRDYRRVLDMHSGELTRRMRVETPRASIAFEYRRFLSRSDKHLVVQQISYEVLHGNAEIRFESGVDADVRTNGYDHFSKVETQAGPDVCRLAAVTDHGDTVWYISAVLPEQPLDLQPEQRSRFAGYSAVCTAKNSFLKLTKIFTSKDIGTASDDLPLDKTYGELLQESSAQWDALWKVADVRVRGDEPLQNALRFSIYHLLRAPSQGDPRVQICAKGFAGEAYYGRYFWDTEIYLLPFYLYTDPAVAKNFLLYRYHTLDGARSNARRYNCRGARYPWQSGLTGEEQCSLWEYADNEIHITADVAYAVMHYYAATGDEQFMLDAGLEMLIETARFWIDRADPDENGVYHLLNVMGPDEYSAMTRDNAFTNQMVRYHIRSALEMLEKLGQERHFAMITEEEIHTLRRIADTLPIPRDEKTGTVLQSADFYDYAVIDIDAIWKDRTKAFGHYITHEKLYRSRVLKQADVIAMMTLFPAEFSDEEVRRAYEMYMPITTHDSSLSPVGHSIVANRIGKQEDVKKFIDLAMEVDMSEHKKGAEDGIHIANCGCLWQLIVHGFAGVPLPMFGDMRKIRPQLPPRIGELEFNLYEKGVLYNIRVDRAQVTVTPV